MQLSPLPVTPPQETIPVRSISQPWRGTIEKKPWEHDVTCIIPVLEPDRSFELVLQLIRLQTVKPYILLIDTGSTPDTMRWLESLRSPDLELHTMRLNAVCHPSEPVSMALDAGVAMIRTRFAFFTHSDCFLTRQTAIEELRGLAEKHVVAGHQISPRPYPGWETELGHTMLMVDQDRLNELGVRWSMRDAMRRETRPSYWPDYMPDAKASPNYPDTETGFNQALARLGIPGHITGTEENFQRNTDEWMDHLRSLACSKIYSAEYQAKALKWLPDAVAEAKQRITEWSKA